jgi:anti-anti-sigma factor
VEYRKSCIAAVFAVADHDVAHVRLAGPVDLAGDTVLAAAANQVTAMAPAAIVIDLADVTFVSSTLANFIARMQHAVPQAAVTLQHCTAMVHVVLNATGLDAYVAGHDHSCGATASTRAPHLYTLPEYASATRPR